MSIGEELASVAPPRVQFAGFWRRLAALFIDALLLAVLGWCIGHFFYDRLIAMGQFGRAVGFPITLAYFGVLNSSLGGGATFGKRAMGMKGVARDGGEISLLRSIARAAIFILPQYLNGFDFAFLNLKPGALNIVMALDILIIFGIGGASIYLYLANWRTRQAMHDLVAGTFVIAGASSRIEQHIAKIHIVVVLIWLALMALSVPVATQFASPSWKAWFSQAFDMDYDALRAVQSLVNADPDVLNSSVTTNTTTFVTYGQPATKTTFLVVTVTLRRRTDDTERAADRIAAIVLQKFPDILHKDRLSILVRYGYETGIWSMWIGHRDAFTPSEWNERIRQASGNGRAPR